jgi:hypothetical protein
MCLSPDPFTQPPTARRMRPSAALPGFATTGPHDVRSRPEHAASIWARSSTHCVLIHPFLRASAPAAALTPAAPANRPHPLSIK